MSLSEAQQRVLDYLREKSNGDFIIVPSGVCNDVRTFEILTDLGLIEGDWRPYPLPPGSFAMYYRAVSNA